MCSPRLALSTGLIFIVSVFLSGWAQAQSSAAPDAAVTTPIGKVVSAKGTFNIEHVSAVVVQASVGQSKIGDLVYKGDIVSTGADSAVGITFSDGTAFNLSSNARMTLNEFVYDPKGTSNSTLFNLSKGTFTFVAGKVAKTGDMRIDTPVATMGIRGTTPRVEIRDDGTVAFSTLIEDKKAIEKGAAAANKRRQTNNGSAPGTSTTGSASSPQQGEKKVETAPKTKLGSSYDINVKICRGC
jgi:hypothetical protein